MKLFTKSAATLALLAVGLAFAGTAGATVVTMHFDGITNADGFSNGGQFVNGYYDGGCTTPFPGNARAPDCAGTNYGVVWSNAIAGDTGATNAFWNNIALAPSPDNAIGFLTGTAATMTVAAGFNTGFSFWYSAIASGFVTLEGKDSTGAAWSDIVNLAATTRTCGADADLYCWTTSGYAIPTGVTVTTVDFGGAANNIIFDNITFGSVNPGVPEPGALGMFGLGVLLIGGFLGLRKRFS